VFGLPNTDSNTSLPVGLRHPSPCGVQVAPLHGCCSSQKMLTLLRELTCVVNRPLAICQLSDGRLDGVASLKQSRSVDVAAAALIVREAGGHVTTPDRTPLPLDLNARTRIVAARDEEMATRLAGLLWPDG